MIKCPNCGSTAQISQFNKQEEREYHKDIGIYIRKTLEVCSRCSYHFVVKTYYKQIKEEVSDEQTPWLL